MKKIIICNLLFCVLNAATAWSSSASNSLVKSVFEMTNDFLNQSLSWNDFIQNLNLYKKNHSLEEKDRSILVSLLKKDQLKPEQKSDLLCQLLPLTSEEDLGAWSHIDCASLDLSKDLLVQQLSEDEALFLNGVDLRKLKTSTLKIPKTYVQISWKTTAGAEKIQLVEAQQFDWTHLKYHDLDQKELQKLSSLTPEKRTSKSEGLQSKALLFAFVAFIGYSYFKDKEIIIEK